jgi:hypothetical protein
VGAAHHFHSRQPDPDPSRLVDDDTRNPAIGWPNYHSGWNGDYQEIRVSGSPHVVLADPADSAGVVRYLPAHPHEGSVGPPAGDSTARVIAVGRSSVTGRDFNLAVAFQPVAGAGPAIAESSFHHFADYNWDLDRGAPSFVDDPPGDTLAGFPQALRATQRYVRNLALWLGGRAGETR